ncbi:hypothetical protein BDU57DRAFT_307629 [Ampelomyces quisqualis]|uniref:Uncharacterized protein n=1 Tax=Ampelomyces quisqualis TaxID=50730 RepID=A0A6A5QHP1_AMPQU|nr:hypothetical protein BDU57DRAFT_307629 [Ampelomyces quisqualis]
MMIFLLLSSPQKPSGMTLATTARQKADTSAVEEAKSVKRVCSVVLSVVLSVIADCQDQHDHVAMQERIVYLLWTIVTEKFGIRATMMQSSQSIYKRHGSTTQSLRHAGLPLFYCFFVGYLAIQSSAHALVDLLFAQRIVFKRHSRLTTVYFGGEGIV